MLLEREKLYPAWFQEDNANAFHPFTLHLKIFPKWKNTKELALIEFNDDMLLFIELPEGIMCTKISQNITG